MRALFAALATDALTHRRPEERGGDAGRGHARPPQRTHEPRRRQLRSAIRARLTFANVVAVLALFVALGGGSIALGTLRPPDRKVVKRIAGAEVTKRAPGLSVGHAAAADTAAKATTAARADHAASADTAARADTAAKADHATSADSAAKADHASEADHATAADSATNATRAATADQLSCSAPVTGTGEMVRVGSFCIDKYEASIWTEPDGGTQLTTPSQLDAACPDDGQPRGSADCESFYARSVPGVQPTDYVTWFQAQQALANSGRRLPQNAEWQEAVAGTPDSSASCVTGSETIDPTGSLPTCVSRFGAHDMVGNLSEWVADWVPASTDCPSWGGFSFDLMCLAGASTTVKGPGALIRSGYNRDPNAGPLSVADLSPQSAVINVGFRGAR
jgi:formylglycine-generating enzyme required for sulfatase activity